MRVQSRSVPLRRLFVLAPAAALLAIAVPVLSATPAAAATSAPHYSHSWYITTNSTSTMYNRGLADGKFDTVHCTAALIVLDFGQPTQWHYSGSGYQQYGTWNFNSAGVFLADDQILALAENYAAGWWDGTSSCPYLHLALGTNNYNECPAPGIYALSTCSVSTAGAEWAALIKNFNAWLQVKHRDTSTGTYWWYGQQENIQAADDIEHGYDCAAKTRQFIAAYNANTTYAMFDYGDFATGGCWAPSDMYYVGWGGADEWNIPETYTSTQINSLIAVERSQGDMYPSGNMTTCAGSDPLPTTTTCSNGYYAPVAGWNALYNSQAAAGLGEGNMAYTTNIQWQP